MEQALEVSIWNKSKKAHHSCTYGSKMAFYNHIITHNDIEWSHIIKTMLLFFESN